MKALVSTFEDQKIRSIPGEHFAYVVVGDVADVLEYEHTNDLRRLIDDEHVRSYQVRGRDGKIRKHECAAEPGLYQVLARVRKPKAKAFQKWLFEKVIAEIRKTGRYNHNTMKADKSQSHNANRPIRLSQYAHENGLDWCEGKVVECITQHAQKGNAKDLHQAKRYIDQLLELEHDKGGRSTEDDAGAFLSEFEGHEIRTVKHNGQLAIVAKDIAKALEYKSHHTIYNLVDPSCRGFAQIPTHDGPQEMRIVTRVGLRQVLVKSRKPKSADIAKAFDIDVYRAKVTTIETEVTSRVRSVFEGYKTVIQKQFGPYRADIWFPQFDLIIEVDEDGHRRYNDIKEAARQGFIESANQSFIRYTPEEQPIEWLFGRIHSHIVEQLS